MRKILLIAGVTGLILAASADGATLFTENFNDGSGFTTSTSFFSDGIGDYLGLTGGSNDFGGDSTPSSLKAYTGFTGSYLTGMDLDGEGASSLQTFTWTGIDITGFTALEFYGDFAEFFDSPGSIDSSDQLYVEAQIDGSGFTTILEFTPGSFTSASTPSNGFFERGALTLGSAAQTFSAAISGTGSNLDLRLIVDLDSGGEDFGVDNFQITGNAVPEPRAIILVLIGIVVIALRRRR